MSAQDEPKKKVNEIDYVFDNVKMPGGREKIESQVAQKSIEMLEKRLAELEARLPKPYEEVKFLNYKNRKRILVRPLNPHSTSFR